MRIVILGSVALPVPPPMQGGTERIAWWQAQGLAARGHKVTLIAARGSKPDPAYTLVEIGGGDTVAGSMAAEVGAPSFSSHQGPDQGSAASGSGVKSVMGLETVRLPAAYTEGSRTMRKELVYTAQVAQWLIADKDEYDVILNNMRGGESVLVPLAKELGKPFATVMHLPLFTELADFFREHQTPVITISNAQRVGFDGLRYIGTVYNATDLEQLSFQEAAEDYVLNLGSVAPHKNQKDAILAARAAGKKIILAGKIGNKAYWESEIAPLVDGVSVVHKGEMSMDEKVDLIKHAKALLFPIVWPEPFGLVMIEAMGCGVPVIAYKNGAVPEVVADGETGYIVGDVQGMTGAIGKIDQISRALCRRYVEEHFTKEKMIDSLEASLTSIYP